MTTAEYRQDDVLGHGYCPRCHRSITIDTALHGVCPQHGKVTADFSRPTGWTDPDGYMEVTVYDDGAAPSEPLYDQIRKAEAEADDD